MTDRTTIVIPAALRAEAQELGLNISAIARTALEYAIVRAKQEQAALILAAARRPYHYRVKPGVTEEP